MGSRHKLGRPTERARNLRNNATEAEKELWSRLRRSQLAGLKFSRQLPIAGYICDFVCRGRKLVVELDGSQHVEAEDYDTARTTAIEAEGFRVIRFWNSDLVNMEGVLAAILAAADDASRAPTPQPLPRAGGGVSDPHPRIS